MSDARFITAIGTPLQPDDTLHVQGLAQQLDDEADGGIDSLLVAGTMGLMPLLADDTWKQLVAHTLEFNRDRFELLIGATDTSTRRVLQRIEHLNALKGIDGVVVMAPGTIKFTTDEYGDYFETLADASKHPLYLYDLQPLTGVDLPVDLLRRLADHRNIAGIKLSANAPKAASLRMHLDGAPFRLIVAEPTISDILFRAGFHEHLDGIYAMCPRWATRLAEAARRDDWDEAAQWQHKLTRLKETVIRFPLWGAFTAIMNLRGIEGRFAPRPIRMLTDAQRRALLDTPLAHELMAEREGAAHV